MDRDGTNDGDDLELTRAVADAVPVPVIASGGAGELGHLSEAIASGRRRRRPPPAPTSTTEQHTVAEAKERLAADGISVRR